MVAVYFACPGVSLDCDKVMRAGHGWRDIVVVGASAGGVQALSALFSHFPPEIPIAFFVVLHLPPHYQSTLPSILERAGGGCLPNTLAMAIRYSRGECMSHRRTFI